MTTEYRAGYVIHHFNKSRHWVRFTPCQHIRPCEESETSLAIKSSLPHIEMTVFYCGVHDSKEWQADKWSVTFINKKTGFAFPTDYKTGTERRKPAKRTAFTSGTETPQSNFDAQTLSRPNIADVLYCLLSDADADKYTFMEWCDNFGYDSDSIKASGMYHACRDTARNLNKLLTHDERVKLSELLQDY